MHTSSKQIMDDQKFASKTFSTFSGIFLITAVLKLSSTLPYLKNPDRMDFVFRSMPSRQLGMLACAVELALCSYLLSHNSLKKKALATLCVGASFSCYHFLLKSVGGGVCNCAGQMSWLSYDSRLLIEKGLFFLIIWMTVASALIFQKQRRSELQIGKISNEISCKDDPL